MPETTTSVRPTTAPPPEPGVDQALANLDPWWSSGAMLALEQLAATGRPFTSDDLRDEPFALPEPHHPSSWGALFASAARRGIIRPVGYIASRTSSRRGGALRVWRGRPTRTRTAAA